MKSKELHLLIQYDVISYHNFPVIEMGKPLRILYRIKGDNIQKYLAKGECVNKMQYTHTVEYYPGIQRNEVLIHATNG